MRLIKLIGILILFFFVGALFMKNADTACLQGRDGHIAYTDNGQKMFVSHTEINDGVPIMKLCAEK